MKNFNTYLANLDMDFWHDLCAEQGELHLYKKGAYFCRAGEKSRLLGFIETGSFKLLTHDSDGEESITGFVFAGTPVGDYLNVVSKSRPRTDIVALTDAKVWVCDGSVVENIFRQNPALRIKIAEGLLAQGYDRFLDLYRKSPKERYAKLLSDCPEILQQVPLKELASYLHITPTHLSRIRREITFQE